MTSEQAKGKTADKRSDIWSFGVIVYELLTGQRMFAGESAVEILGGVLNKEPDLSAAPARVHRLLKWCLEKDRKKRLAAISDARGLLNEEIAPMAAPQAAATRGWLWQAVAAVLVLGAGVAGWGWWKASRPVLHPMMRFDVDMGPLAVQTYIASAVLSPDGTQVVYVGRIPEGGGAYTFAGWINPKANCWRPWP